MTRFVTWLCLVPLQWLLGIVAFVLAPFVVAFCSTPDRLHLTRFRWLETIDFDLTGDPSWREKRLIGINPFGWERITVTLWYRLGFSPLTWAADQVWLWRVAGLDALSWINRVRWLWRNGGNYVNYMIWGAPGDTFWASEVSRDGHFWRRYDGYWLYRRFIPIGRRRLELFFGWNLFSVKSGRCKLVCQIRVRSI